jgi:hypothetical protein
MIGSDGRRFDDPEACLGHARERIPEAYRDSLDFSRWAKRQRQRRGRDLPVKDEMKSAPHLWRVGGAYPCSNSVRRVAEVSSTAQSG